MTDPNSTNQPQQPAYNQAPPVYNQAPGYAPAPQQKYNVLAIISLVGAIIGFNVIAVILGFIALSQIKKTGEQGRGLALAGIIIGFIYLVFFIGLIIFFGVIAATLGTSGTYYVN